MKGDYAGARRYARALLDVTLQQGDPAAVRRGLESVAATLAQHTELRSVLAHPAVPAERKKALVAAIWGAAAVEPLVRRLLDILAGRNRVALLPAVSRAYAAAWNAQRGVVSAEAVSAVPLGPDQRDALSRAVARAAGREVELATVVDAAVLGGVLLKMEGRVFDGTVRGRLRSLRERLATGAPRV